MKSSFDRENVRDFNDVFKRTPLWKHLTNTASSQNIATVDKLVSKLSPLLDRINESFPTYTLHNGQHQLNILNIMSDLLGSRLKELSGFETGMLILATFFHDIGMVFEKDERNSILSEADFATFLKSSPSANLSLKNNEADIVIEHYCRWAHAKRVWIYLDKFQEFIVWDGLNFRSQLGEVCLSHNEDVSYIKNDHKFETNFWLAVDLRFCAILLRLADILDFDNSRSPESVFNYLKLDNPHNKSEEVSFKEWSKHLASDGFSFSKWNETIPYDLEFKALPNHPAVENDIRDFLDIIELEIQKCSTLVKFCSARWSNFILPDKIGRSNVRSQGYKFGNYKFTLDQQQILDLLMGESLYDDELVFIRELIQNSLDTCRDREFHEHKIGNLTYKSAPILISTWIDYDGYRWMRIDDEGMGMTEEIINKYFLKVGNSYYNSNDFKVRKLTYKQFEGVDFTPISRFGIGLLSTFILGDQVEINTKSILCDYNVIFPIRLSLKGLHNFYILQTENDIPSPMPISNGFENNYRNTFGTSISVRFKMNKDQLQFDIKQYLDSIIFNPPIRILLQDVGYIGEFPDVSNKRWCDIQSFPVNKDVVTQVEDYFKSKIQSDFFVHLFSIDLSHFSHISKLRGQIAFIFIPYPKMKYLESDEFDDLYPRLELHISYGGINGANTRDEYQLEMKDRMLPDDDKTLISKMNLKPIVDKITILDSIPFGNLNFSNLLIVHNGITINNREDYFSESPSISLSIKSPVDWYEINEIGLIELEDELRPDLSISRSKIMKLDWHIISAINYAIFKGLHSLKGFHNLADFHFLKIKNIKTDWKLYKELSSDNLVEGDAYWIKENIIESELGFTNIKLIISSGNVAKLTSTHFLITFNRNPIEGFEQYLISTLLQKYCCVYIKLTLSVMQANSFRVNLFFQKRNKLIDESLDYFPPLTFVEYDNFIGLFPAKYLETGELIFFQLNINHKFSIWLIKCAEILYSNYTIHFSTLLGAKSIYTINDTLRRLNKILPTEYKPNSDLIITIKDLEVDFDSLQLQ